MNSHDFPHKFKLHSKDIFTLIAVSLQTASTV